MPRCCPGETENGPSMTGLMNTGPFQDRKDTGSPVTARSSPFDLSSAQKNGPQDRHRSRRLPIARKMSLAPANGQTIQLTPLWEHVVRTRRFPTEIDAGSTFLEISERLRDPEWEVRQHALRVLMDVLPTLRHDVLDRVMQPVVPELINNLGHPAPAVRKGALDTLRVYLVHSSEREEVAKNILQDGLNRSEAQDPHQTNITTGVILSAPSLLFPSSSSPTPNTQLIKDTTIALASRLAQVAHQEAVLKALMKIRDAVGDEAFDGYLAGYDPKLRRNIDILAKIYNVKPSRRSRGRRMNSDKSTDDKETKEVRSEPKWDSDSDTSGIAEEDEEAMNGTSAMPGARVVLETEIKFDEETAITMTILEEKADDDDDERDEMNEQDDESGTDLRNDTNDLADRRKTPRRVHFGGEVVKLRTPDSDESLEASTPKTRIPLPVSPVTRMPEHRRPSSQPCSPYRERRTRRRVRSVSSSPRREFYTHNADLSPRKSILLRTGSPTIVVKPVETGQRRRMNSGRREGTDSSLGDSSLGVWRKDSDEVGEIKMADSSADETRREEVVLLGRGVDPSKEDDSVFVRPETKEISESVEEVSGVRQSAFEVLPVEDSEKIGANLVVDLEGNVSSGMIDESTDPVQRVQVDPGEKPEDNVEVTSVVPEVAEKRDDKNRGESVNEGVSDPGVSAGSDRGIERKGSRKEPSWEDLGLVGQEVLDDLHNKEDWRARVRGFERVASALRTTSALIAIEPRLGSLLHAVLGCERSCRVAAAGLAVAKVVVAGVSEDALRKRLPQLAWGLARQGGPCAAQLARIAMLRLRPALMLEQLLQPQCLNARNAKTRENALQLLIFSLVTFPSTEFKVDAVASKVATVVPDRRRRVRQAALDTLAVLAQIYDPEEVLAAGRRAAEGRHDGRAMISAIRARLARKSLPLVSADGLVVYGLQISPSVQIATGPDVDWIVAGSGSVSPGTGRTRGQIIASTKPERSRIIRNGLTKSRENPWIERPNFVAVGVGLRSKDDQPMAWQIVPAKTQEDATRQDQIDVRSTQNSIDTSRGRDVDIALEREAAAKTESRIPVLSSRDRGPKSSTSGQDSTSLDPIGAANTRRGTRETRRISFGQETDQQYAMHQRGRKVQQPRSTSGRVQPEAFDRSMDSRYTGHRTAVPYGRSSSNDTEERRDHPLRAYQRYVERGKVASGGPGRDFRSSSVERRQQNFPNALYSSIQRDERFLEDDSCRPLQTAPTPLTSVLDEEEDENRRDYSSTRARIYQRTRNPSATRKPETEDTGSTDQRPEFPLIRGENAHRRRLRSLSPSQLHRRRQFLRMPSNEFHAVSMFDIEKAVNEADYNERNKHHFLPDPSYPNDALSQPRLEDGRDHPLLDTDLAGVNRDPVTDGPTERQDQSDSRSSTPRSREDDEAAFNVITGRTSPEAVRGTVDVFLDPLGEKVENVLEDNSKDWSSEDETRLRDESQDGYGSFKTETTGSDSTDYGAGSGTCERRRSSVSVVSTERILGTEVLHPGSPVSGYTDLLERKSPSRVLGSPLQPMRTDHQGIIDTADVIDKSPARSSTRGSPRKLSYEEETKDSSEEKVISSALHEEPASRFETLDQVDMENPPAIVIASRPHSRQNESYTRNAVQIDQTFDELDDVRSFHDDRKMEEVLDDEQNRDSASETNTEPAILKIESHATGSISPPRRMISRVPRVTGRPRPSASKGSSERAEKPKPMVQQCFAQLENKDWETTLKGLKALSQIAKQQPEQLDLYAAGTIGRVLGNHVKNLRSQVARAACAAAGDVFSSRIRGIDQDIEDIAGPLLHRTADTNRFLRADSNAALDQMVDNLPAQKTIGVIVHRGANHQNAIVRAATARLLSAIVDRLGPEQTMLLQRDVRDKLLNTGARLLIDGNLDARNHAKKMFRRLTRCDGFRRALTDAVPETTLRHIDKALKSL